MADITDRYAIVGVGESPRSKQSGKSTLRMAAEAARAAIADAGIEPSEIDCVLSYQMLDSCDGHSVATQLGIRPVCHADSIGGGSSTETLVSQAIGMIEAGLCKTVLIFRSMNGRSTASTRKGGGGGLLYDLGGMFEYFYATPSFIGPYGFTTAAQQFGMVAMRHMWETGTTEEHLGHVCVTFYEHAQRNPTAFLRGKPLDMDAYMASPYISTPFRIHDYCLESDEANAIIVTSADRAADCRSTPVYVMGAVGRSCTPLAMPWSFGMDDITDIGGFYAAPEVFGMAGVGPDDIDVAAIYDCFSWVVLAQLEAFGFVGRGEAGPFVAEGNLRLGGKLPSNTGGGMLAEGYTHGMNNVIELVRQVRHDYDGADRQVVDCEIGLSAAWDGPHAASALILRR
jgi:acetyl-CoA acetyltransferase